MIKIRTIVNTLIIITLTSLSAHASNYADTFGASPMGVALGGAMTARVNDWSSIYYNIAGLGKTVDSNDIVSDGDKEFKNQFAAAYMYNKPSFSIDNFKINNVKISGRYNSVTGEPWNTDGDKNLETGTFVIGGALDLNLFYKMPSYISSARLGLLVSLNDDLTLVKISDTSLQTHNFFRYGRETQSLMLLIGAGFGLFDDLMGFGMGTASSMGGTGRIVATDLGLEQEVQNPDMQANFDFEVAKLPLILGGYIKPGRIFPLLEGVDLGISYRQESYLYVDDFKMFTVTDAGNMKLTINTQMFDFYQPPITRVGAALSTDSFIVSGDLELRQWSKFKVSEVSKGYYIDENADQTTIDQTIQSIPLIPIPKLEDIIIPRVGLQINMNDTTALLMGYYYEQSCVPNKANKGIFNLLDNDKHVGSCGIKFRLPKIALTAGLQGPVDITATYQYQYLVDRDVKKTDPIPENPDYSYGGTCHTVMAGIVMSL